jgi:fatty-acyl-CoA synthase
MTRSMFRHRLPTIQERILFHLDAAPDARAIAFVDHRGEFEWQTRAQFFGEAARWGGVLESRGVTPGDAVVIVSVEPEFAATSVLATLQLGAIPLLVAPPAIQGVNSNLQKVLSHTIRKSGARLALLSDGKIATGIDPAADDTGADYIAGAEVFRAAPDREPPRVVRDAEEVGGLQLTSGTTGFPRVCVWRHRAITAALDGMADAMGVTGDDVCLNWTPLYHDMGLVNNFFLSLSEGMGLALMSPIEFIRKPALWLRALHATRATVTWSPNFGYAVAAQRIRDDELEGVRLDHVRGFWNAAERIHYDTICQFQEKFEHAGVSWSQLKTNFGCAENIGGATFTAPNKDLLVEHVDSAALHGRGEAVVLDESSAAAEGDWIVGAGCAYPGMTLHILGDDDQELPDGRVGRLALETPSRMDGYKEDPAETEAALFGGWVLTGDLGYTRAGEFFWTGRDRERINLHGKKYDPSDFESVLLTIDGLRKGCFVAFGVDDKAQGTQTLVIVAEVEDSISADQYKALGNLVRRTIQVQLGVTIAELAFVAKGTLTKTSSGKRRHRHFREMFVGGELDAVYQSGVGRIG